MKRKQGKQKIKSEITALYTKNFTQDKYSFLFSIITIKNIDLTKINLESTNLKKDLAAQGLKRIYGYIDLNSKS